MENWHADFNPKRFLAKVNLPELLERNEAYNSSSTTDSRASCILCQHGGVRGIFLNNKQFPCQSCFSEAALISYPEKYEKLRRDNVSALESRRLAYEAFAKRFEYHSKETHILSIGWVSIVLAFFSPWFLLLTAVLLLSGYLSFEANKAKLAAWRQTKAEWENENPMPSAPILKHFHDPAAELSARDRAILAVFNHWPGYPPFWKYLRTIVIARDVNRCQVTGCPSRLELHVHHMRSVAEGGQHVPENLVALCDFHHALEPDKGHERIWGDIKTRYFTLVASHERGDRTATGHHLVKAHLRRLQLASSTELEELKEKYGFACPDCRREHLRLTILPDRSAVSAECPICEKSIHGALQLTEETGPRLAEVLFVSRNRGRWRARWDMLEERKSAVWGSWSSTKSTNKRRTYKEKIVEMKESPSCPKCKSAMRLIKPRPSDHWSPFWGCTQYRVTGCKGR